MLINNVMNFLGIDIFIPLALCIGPNFIREIVLQGKDREGIFCHVFGDIL
jgi:hypothetical protein